MAWKPPEEELKKREKEFGPVGRYLPQSKELPGLIKRKAEEAANATKKMGEAAVWAAKELPGVIKRGGFGLGDAKAKEVKK